MKKKLTEEERKAKKRAYEKARYASRTIDYVVYRHRNKKTLEIFYVGSGTIKRSRGSYYKTDVWKNIVSKDGYTIEIVAEGLSEDDALDLEYLMIDSYGTLLDNDGPLVNIKRDRYKSHWTTNIKTGNGSRGRIPSEETKAKMSKASLGNTHLLGHKHSEETKAKMSKAGKGRKKSEEHKAKIGKAHKGRKHSEEFKARLSKARLGYKHSEEIKFKMSEDRRRSVISDENYELLLKDLSNIDKEVYKNLKELSIKYNVKMTFTKHKYYKLINNK